MEKPKKPLTMLDLRLGLIPEDLKAEASRRLAPIFARIVRRILEEERTARAPATRRAP